MAVRVPRNGSGCQAGADRTIALECGPQHIAGKAAALSNPHAGRGSGSVGQNDTYLGADRTVFDQVDVG
jgi:hypothetical protein